MNISAVSIIVVILMLGLLVTIHELGHFFAAMLLKIKAYEVSIFVGPKLLSWNRKGVDFSIRALPFGAYVRFSDIDDEGNVVESDNPDLLINQKRWKRLIVAVAGPFMNAVLGVLIFSIMYCVFGYTGTEIGPTFEGTQLYAAVEAGGHYEMGDRITHINGERIYTYLDFYYETMRGVPEYAPMTLRLVSKETGDPYEITLEPVLTTRPMLGITHYDGTDNKYNGWEIIGVMESQNNGSPILKEGDYLIAVDGVPVADEGFDEFFASLCEGDTMHLTYVRNGETYEADCVKTLITYPNDRGLYILYNEVDSADRVFDAIRNAALMPVTIANISVKAIGDVFEGEEEVYNMVSGPVGVTTVVSDVVDDVDDTVPIKVTNIISIIGIISIGLTFTNMLPIPGLDGVQILLLLIEMVIGRKISKKAEGVINGVGFALLIGLVIFALASDVIRIFVGG